MGLLIDRVRASAPRSRRAPALLLREVIVLHHLPGMIMIADLLTKSVARAIFHELIKLLDNYFVAGVACPSLSS